MIRCWLIGFLVLQIFAPYQIYDIQLQPLFTLTMILYLLKSRISIYPRFKPCLILFSFILLYSLILSIFNYSELDVIKFFSGFHNNLLIIVVTLILLVTPVECIDKRKELAFLSKALFLGLTFCLLTQILQIFSPNLANSVIGFFNTSFTTDVQTYELSSYLGQYIGLLNVAVVGGFIYSVGLVLFVGYAKNYIRKHLYFLGICILFLGGVLTLSKVFFITIILFPIAIFIFAKINLKLRILIIFSILFGFGGGLLTIVADIFPQKTITYLNYEVESIANGSFWDSRYSSKSINENNSKIITAMSSNEILLGKGFPKGDDVDSGPLWYLIQSGLIGLSAIGVIFISLLRYVYLISLDKNQLPIDKAVWLTLYLLLLGAFLATPIMLMRRAGVLFVLILYYLVICSMKSGCRKANK